MRPSIVISEDLETCSASCRSVKSFDMGKLIFDSIKSGKLISGGGHKMAGGFTIKRSKILDFKTFLKSKYKQKREDLEKIYDSELKISLIDNDLYNKVNEFSPFGIGNPRPKFIITNCYIRYPRIVGEKHLSLYLEDTYANKIKAIAFNSLGTKLGEMLQAQDQINAIVVSLILNSWAGEDNIEVNIEDLIT